MKKIILTLITLASRSAIAEGQLIAEVLHNQLPLTDSLVVAQNPYLGMPSGGGTQEVSESAMAAQNIAQKWFADGSWNLFGGASYVDQNGANNYGYGVNLFAQSGAVAGFSFGGLLTIMNPYSSGLNPRDPLQQSQTLPIAQQITPQQLFAEYHYPQLLQFDGGWIGISNSPWMSSYQNNALNLVTYQGALLNLNPGGGWLLSGFAINGAQLLGETGFSQQTMYNSVFNAGTDSTVLNGSGSPGTLAVGANWTSANNDLNLRLWGYQFENFSNLVYGDTALKLAVNDDLGFSLGFQGALQGSNSTGNSLNSSGYGDSVQSTMLGAQLGFNYKIFGLQLGYNNIWGPDSGYQGGGLVSPYTYQIATDPLYTTGWMAGMVEKAAGQAYKIAPSLALLDNNLVITPSYQHYATTFIPASSEYDLQISYALPQVKGLTFFAGYGYLLQPDEDDANATNYQGQLMLSYLY